MATQDVLSNEEVDAIMETVADKDSNDNSASSDIGSSSASYDSEAKVHRAFDFASREHFALAQMKGLSVANEKFCLEFQLELSRAFGIPVEVTLAKLEILKIDECMTAIKEDAVLNMVKINLASGKGLLVVNGGLISELINRYFGSQLAQSSGSKSGRALSTTESRINDRILNLFASSLCIGWKDIAALELNKTLTETNPDFVKLGEKDELGVRFTLQIELGDFTGSVEWLLPYSSIEPLSSRADSSSSISDKQKASAWGEQLYDNIQEVNLDVQVVMTEFEVSLKDVQGFQVGTVLPLVSNPSDVQVRIEDIAVFSGEYGVHDDRKAVSLKHRIELSGS